MVYAPRARTRGFAPVARGCLERALKLYRVHIALTLVALVIFACAFWLSGVNTLIEAHGRSYVFASPATASPASRCSATSSAISIFYRYTLC